MNSSNVRTIAVALTVLGCLLSALLFYLDGERGSPPPSDGEFTAQPAQKNRDPVREYDEADLTQDASLDSPAEPGAANDIRDPGIGAPTLTRLPLRLLGTMTGETAARSKAIILDTSHDKHMIVRMGDELRFHPGVTVHAIAQRVVLIKTQAGIERLPLSMSLGDGEVALDADSLPLRNRPESATRPVQSTLQLARNKGPGVRNEVIDAMDRMARHFSEDLELALDSSGSINGLRAVGISEGGLLEAAGVRRSDVIEGVNGVKINTAEGAKRVLRDLASCQPMSGMVDGSDGQRTVEFTAELLEEFGCAQ